MLKTTASEHPPCLEVPALKNRSSLARQLYIGDASREVSEAPRPRRQKLQLPEQDQGLNAPESQADGTQRKHIRLSSHKPCAMVVCTKEKGQAERQKDRQTEQKSRTEQQNRTEQRRTEQNRAKPMKINEKQDGPPKNYETHVTNN